MEDLMMASDSSGHIFPWLSLPSIIRCDSVGIVLTFNMLWFSLHLTLICINSVHTLNSVSHFGNIDIKSSKLSHYEHLMCLVHHKLASWRSIVVIHTSHSLPYCPSVFVCLLDVHTQWYIHWCSQLLLATTKYSIQFFFYLGTCLLLLLVFHYSLQLT